MIKLSDFPFICGICLKHNELLIPFVDQLLLELFETLINIDIQSRNKLPQNICTNCSTQLKGISFFIDNAKYSDIFLKYVLINNKELNEIHVDVSKEAEKITQETNDTLEETDNKEDSENPEMVEINIRNEVPNNFILSEKETEIYNNPILKEIPSPVLTTEGLSMVDSQMQILQKPVTVVLKEVTGVLKRMFNGITKCSNMLESHSELNSSTSYNRNSGFVDQTLLHTSTCKSSIFEEKEKSKGVKRSVLNMAQLSDTENYDRIMTLKPAEDLKEQVNYLPLLCQDMHKKRKRGCIHGISCTECEDVSDADFETQPLRERKIKMFCSSEKVPFKSLISKVPTVKTSFIQEVSPVTRQVSPLKIKIKKEPIPTFSSTEFTCSVCTKTFAKRRYLKRHSERHTCLPVTKEEKNIVVDAEQSKVIRNLNFAQNVFYPVKAEPDEITFTEEVFDEEEEPELFLGESFRHSFK